MFAALRHGRRGRRSKKLANRHQRRFAYKLALQLGWFNVDEMLATGSPTHLAEWQEFAALEPWGDDWERSSLITARLINSLMQIAAGFGGKELSEMDAIDDDAFVPKRRLDTKTKRQQAQDKALDAAVAASDEISNLLRA